MLDELAGIQEEASTPIVTGMKAGRCDAFRSPITTTAPACDESQQEPDDAAPMPVGDMSSGEASPSSVQDTGKVDVGKGGDVKVNNGPVLLLEDLPPSSAPHAGRIRLPPMAVDGMPPMITLPVFVSKATAK